LLPLLPCHDQNIATRVNAVTKLNRFLWVSRMNLQAILWDLDGTLVDSEELHFQAWRQIAPEHGVEYTYENFIHSFGRTNADILADLFGEAATPALIAEISQNKETNFRTLVAERGAGLLPGVAMWLARFEAVGVRQTVASSAPMANIIAMLAALGIGDYFSSVVSGARLPQGKPDPTIFQLAAAAAGAPAENCLVIEDSLAGIAAARRANMRSIAVGKVIDQPSFHEMLAALPGPTTVPVRSLEQLAWEDLERALAE